MPLHTLEPGPLLRLARTRAGLTQRQLARRAGTAQSVVSRIESGKTDPSTMTLRALLAATGNELIAGLEPVVELDPQLLDDVPRILRLTPEQRLLEVRNLDRFARAARRA